MMTSIAPTVPPTAASAPGAARDPKIWQAAQDFESVLLSELTSLMVSMPSTEAPFGGGHAEEVWRGQLARELGRSMTQRGGLGLADHVYAQMLKAQEDAQARAQASTAVATTALTASGNGPGQLPQSSDVETPDVPRPH